mmetsp:Transcript_43178/g.90417  ORF Transcript_43178/g.90417 Transcript_43178/m.90417 type:complete len:157 (-) Transcript_43178:325-795(-)
MPTVFFRYEYVFQALFFCFWLIFLQVSAEDKGTGKSEKITITNDKGRLSQEEIDRMVQEAKEFEEEDKKVKERIDAKNSLESYIYNIKNTIGDEEKIKDKLTDDDKETLEDIVKKTTEWIEENGTSGLLRFEQCMYCFFSDFRSQAKRSLMTSRRK